MYGNIFVVFIFIGFSLFLGSCSLVVDCPPVILYKFRHVVWFAACLILSYEQNSKSTSTGVRKEK
jgi:hypothetical protein